jgi:hypothetical protein
VLHSQLLQHLQHQCDEQAQAGRADVQHNVSSLRRAVSSTQDSISFCLQAIPQPATTQQQQHNTVITTPHKTTDERPYIQLLW